MSRYWFVEVFIDFYGKSSDIRNPIRCVKFTKVVVRHADIRDKNPSLRMICPDEPHQCVPYASKFEDRSQEETEWQELRSPWSSAGSWPKVVLKLKREKIQQHSFFIFGKIEKLSASNLKSDEREFVVDSDASMQSRRSYDSHNSHWRSAGRMKRLQFTSESWIYSWLWKSSRTRQKSCRSGKLCDENAYSYEWINGQKPHLIENDIRI